MTTPDRSWREVACRLAYLCVYPTLSVFVLGIFLWKPGTNGHAGAAFGDMVYGTAHKPFVYRTLLPTVVRLVASAIPADRRAHLSQSLAEREAIRNLSQILSWKPRYLVEYFIAVILLYLCLCGFLWSLRYLLTGVYRTSTAVQDLTTVLALVGLSQFFQYHSYLYDFPTLFLFTLGLGLMARSRWKGFLVVYVLGCLNKETTILLTLIFVIHFGPRARMGRPLFCGLLLIQSVVFAVIKAGLFVVFRDNPGSFIQFHLYDHNLDFVRVYPLSTLFAWGGFLLLVFYRWAAKPAFLRHGMWIAVPLVVLTFFLGYTDERRDYYELYPILVLLLLHSVSRLLGSELAAAQPSVPSRSQPASPLAGSFRIRERLGSVTAVVRRDIFEALTYAVGHGFDRLGQRARWPSRRAEWPDELAFYGLPTWAVAVGRRTPRSIGDCQFDSGRAGDVQFGRHAGRGRFPAAGRA